MKFKVTKSGKFVCEIEADDARVAGAEAVMRFGAGTYNVSLIREDGDDECPRCGANPPPEELDANDGVCELCRTRYGSPMGVDEEE